MLGNKNESELESNDVGCGRPWMLFQRGLWAAIDARWGVAKRGGIARFFRGHHGLDEGERALPGHGVAV